MNKIHLIMPMGGGGTRFGNKGFSIPKPLIKLQEAPFFYWAVQSVYKFIELQDITFVVLREHINSYQIDEKIKKYYPNANIHVIEEVLNGAVLTCLEGLKDINDELPILINDCDHAFVCERFYQYCKNGDFSEIEGGLLTFISNNPNYSYIEYDEQGKIIGTIEKKVVSNEAVCGAYYFKNKEEFEISAKEYLKKCNYKEFFISGIYNEMIKNNKNIVTFNTEVHIPFGTPEEYKCAMKDKRIGIFK